MGRTGPTRPTTSRARRGRLVRAAVLAVFAAVGILAFVRTGTADDPATSAGPTVDAAVTLPEMTGTAAPVHLFVDCVRGHDANDGSSDRPWRSLEPLRALALRPAASVSLRRGCTFTGGLVIRPEWSGVTVGAFGVGEPPTLRGDGLPKERGVVVVQAPAVSLAGLHIRNAAGFGIEITGADARVDDVEIDEVAYGVRVQAPRATVTSTRVHDLHMHVNTPGGTDDAGAVGFDVWADDVTIQRSSCVNCRAESYDFGFDGGFVEVFNRGHRLRLIDNTARNTQGFLEVGGVEKGARVDDILARGNTVEDGHGGVWIHHDDRFSITASNITLIGNTFVNRSSTVPVLGGSVSVLVLRDNTVVSSGPVSSGGSPAEHTGNRYYVAADTVGFPLDRTEHLSPLDGYRASANP